MFHVLNMTGITQTIIFALIGGVLPALIWLWFWLKEDDVHPEPRKWVFLTFILGMLVVPIALVAQIIINELFLKDTSIELLVHNSPYFGISIIVVWAAIEEGLKLKAAYLGGLHKRSNDEAKDVMVYVITAALGFAALENTLFLFTPLLEGDTTTALITSNIRFIGATLVHVASSAVIGIFMAFSYFKAKKMKKRYLGVGFILSVGLHALFNLSIIKYQESLFTIFFAIWVVVFIVIIFFERIKNIHLNRIRKKLK